MPLQLHSGNMEEVKYASVACTMAEHGKGGICLYNLHSRIIMEEVQYVYLASQSVYNCL